MTAQNRWSTHWDAGHNWALILAAGDGARLQSLTMTAAGVSVPKQFCSVGGGASLLHAAVARAHVVTPVERICAVVAEHHRQWWRELPLTLPAHNIFVQPLNKGTAYGILLPLLRILHRDADASILVLPSDHYVGNETVLATSLQEVRAQLDRRHDSVILLGFDPEDADTELGYIVRSGTGAVREILQFVEKPSAAAARALIECGGLWNSFILAARGQLLLRAFEALCPQIVADMRRIVADERVELDALTQLYGQMPSLDFSRDIVQRCPLPLQALKVPRCGWSDLGTPRRVAEVTHRIRPTPRSRSNIASHRQGFLDLAARPPPS